MHNFFNVRIFHNLVTLACVISAWTLPCPTAQARTYSALVVEAETNRVLYADQPDATRHPASLTKMMTLLLTFDALQSGQLRYTDQLRVSRHAASRAPSKLGLKAGDYISVEDCVLGLVTRSANDAAATLAEAMGQGSEEVFADLMTRRAQSLGMYSTVFRNASGLPDPGQITTASDMARLARTLIRQYPAYYRYFSTPSFTYKNREFKNHNHLLDTYPGADGLKTGFINASGYNLVASAKRDGKRLIGVVFGGRTAAVRDAHMRTLLDVGFDLLEGRSPAVRVAEADQIERPEPLTLLRPPHAPAAAKKVDRISKHPSKEARLLASTAQPDSRARNDKRRLTTVKSEAPAANAKQARWQVQVGTFQRVDLAHSRLSQARKLAPQAFNQAHTSVAPYAKSGKTLYRAYLRGLSWDQAKTGCQTLRRKQIECSMVSNS